LLYVNPRGIATVSVAYVQAIIRLRMVILIANILFQNIQL